ncbi:MAG: hypothetical protein Q4C77_01435 [Eubacteriales bacterium]|nr:hypothetical protein [Eubacteriales bacterium]
MKYSPEKEKAVIIENYIITGTGVNCREVLRRCRPVMKDLCGDAMEPEDWLKHLYQKCLARYFPENFPDTGSPELEVAEAFYMEVLQELLLIERGQMAFDPCRDFAFLTEEELAGSEIREEYGRFIRCFRELKIYEFMRIARDCTPFNTLGHIAGVHHVAMYIARQLKHTPLKIDLALISSAAIIHDIGKFGCRPREMKRVPYLHYYYTDQFARRFQFADIGHTAANHSTWDLELENLSIENLLLIYADFRVKSVRDANGEEVIRFWSLDDSYQVILDKLDNVDEKKRVRYQKVFGKLKDFEDFLIFHGVSVDLKQDFRGKEKEKHTALLTMEEVTERVKYQAIDSNLTIMHHMNHSSRFLSLLEETRSESEWRNVRTYLNILEEYSTYMTMAQKETIIKFLYEMMIHRDGDIRRQAARVTGELIASYGIRYQKEVPEGAPTFDTGNSEVEMWSSVLHTMLIPDHKITEQHRRWLGYAMKRVFQTVMDQIDRNKKGTVLQVLVEYYRKTDWDELVLFLLMDCAADIAFDICTREQRRILLDFTGKMRIQENEELETAAMRFLKLWLEQGWKPEKNELEQILSNLEILEKDPVCCRYLKHEILAHMEGKERAFPLSGQEISLLFQENQRVDTPWIFKLVNLEILKKYCRKKGHDRVFQLGAHLANMLQNSDRIVIKHRVGEDLTEIFGELSETEQYEIAMELMKGLEVGEYSTSKYIPEYLGRIFFYMEEHVQTELVEQFCRMVDSANGKVAVVTLETVGMVLQQSFMQKESGHIRLQRETLEGLLFRGMAHYQEEISQEGFYIVGHSIFGSENISLEQKVSCIRFMGKKLLTLLKSAKKELKLYSTGAALNHIYRFLSEYLLQHQMDETREEKIAFFPGTFDPFSLGHKEIVKEIVRKGFVVYLALDEFSWSKKTQPYKIRRKILQMSVADLKNVYLFPAEIPVNIANPGDLRVLREQFPSKEVYLVVGSDVVKNASAYFGERSEHSVHSFPHIIFERNEEKTEAEKYEDVILGKVIRLKLSAHFERISSTRIRESIDLNRDISSLVDRNVQNYIYDRGLYTRESMYKLMMKSKPVNTSLAECLNEELTSELSNGILKELWDRGTQGGERFREEQVLMIRDEKLYQQVVGVAFYHTVPLSGMYKECGDSQLAAYLRKHVSGRIGVITGVYGRERQDESDNRQTALTELLAHFVREEYSYALCFEAGELEELLLRQGFTSVPVKKGCYLVDLRNPLVLLCDTCMSMKEPFGSNPRVKRQIWDCRRRLQSALASLYPGNLVLCIESDILNHRLMQLITKENGVSMVPQKGKKPGPKMCVPYGKFLRGMLVPNCVTKGLDTEKLYSRDMQSFEIREYPNYAHTNLQMRTIKSFRRPVILVDELYHKGYRIAGIDKVCREEGMTIDKIIVGIMSGSGRDLADMRKKEIDSVYFLPSMRAWFMESRFYPFIGGDSVNQEGEREGNITFLPSVNPILPYYMPHYLKDVKIEDYYALSGLCLDNAEKILKVLETEYQKLTGRKLTISRLGEVMAEPRYPDTSIGNFGGWQMLPSGYVQYEKERLKRLGNLKQ